MSEKRLMIVESTLEHHDRRITDHDGKLQAILEWKSVIEESTEVNRKMVEVGENLLLMLGWVGIVAKWIAVVSAAFAVFFGAFKWLVGKVS